MAASWWARTTSAICNAARAATATEGCTIYVEITPCMGCARAIVQTGIVEIVVSAARIQADTSDLYVKHFHNSEVLFAKAGIKVRRV